MSQADGQRSSSRDEDLPFALKFDRGRGILALSGHSLGPLDVDLLELDIPGLRFPFDLTGGALGLRDRWLQATRLDVTITAEALRRHVSESFSPEGAGLSELSVSLDQGALELFGQISGTSGSGFVLRYLPDMAGERDIVLRPGLFVQLGPPALSMAQVAAATARIAAPAALRKGLDLVVSDLPRRLLASMLPRRGYRQPDHRRLRLRSVDVSPSGLSVRFSALGAPPSTASPEAMALAEVAPLLEPGDAAVEAGRPEEARRAYLDALAREPGHPVLLERLAWLDAASPNAMEAAHAACSRHLASVEHPGLRAILASVELARGDRQAAAGHFERLLDRLGAQGRARVLMLLGELVQAEDPRAAAMRFEAALELMPGHAPALEALQGAYAASGHRQQLEAVGARLVAVLESPRQRAAALAAQGEMWLGHFEDGERAARLFEQALIHSPDETGALLGLADCRAASEDRRGALRCLDDATRVAAADGRADLEARAHFAAGEQWDALGDPRSAAARFHKACDLDPDNLAALERAADTDVTLARHAMADEGYRRLGKLAEDTGDGSTWRRALLGLARLHLDETGAEDAAAPIVKRLLDAHPDDEEVLALTRRLGGEAVEEPPEEREGPAQTAPPLEQARSRPSVPPRDSGMPPPSEPVATTPAGAEVHGLDDVDALLAAHTASPGDLETGRRLAAALEARRDWARLVAVLATLADGAEVPKDRASLLVRMAEALHAGMDDPESAAECLMEAARLLGSLKGAAHAHEAAALLASEGLDEAARDAKSLARELEGPPDRWDL